MDYSERILPEHHIRINDVVEHTDDEGLDDVIERLHSRRDSLLVLMPCDGGEDLIEVASRRKKLMLAFRGGSAPTLAFVVLNVLVHMLLLLIVMAIVAYSWINYHKIEILQFRPQDHSLRLMSLLFRAPQPLPTSEVA